MNCDWAEVQRAYDAGAYYRDLRRMFGLSTSTIHRAVKRGIFVPRSKGDRYSYVNGLKPIDNVDWPNVQKTYDSGKSIRDTCKLHTITRYDVSKAIERGLFVQRSFSDSMKVAKQKHPYKTSDATKKKLRQKQLLLIAERPELSPAHYHSSKKSFPEKIFEDELNRRSIVGWEYNVPVWKYRFDFAFRELLIDVEVDGSSHLDLKVAEKDRRRDDWSRKNGWTVVRFTASRVKTDLVGCVSDVEKILALKRS